MKYCEKVLTPIMWIGEWKERVKREETIFSESLAKTFSNVISKISSDRFEKIYKAPVV